MDDVGSAIRLNSSTRIHHLWRTIHPKQIWAQSARHRAEGPICVVHSTPRLGVANISLAIFNYALVPVTLLSLPIFPALPKATYYG